MKGDLENFTAMVVWPFACTGNTGREHCSGAGGTYALEKIWQFHHYGPATYPKKMSKAISDLIAKRLPNMDSRAAASAT